MTARELKSARDWAVHHEQVAGEMTRRVRTAQRAVDDQACTCSSVFPCLPCQLTQILAGDL